MTKDELVAILKNCSPYITDNGVDAVVDWVKDINKTNKIVLFVPSKQEHFCLLYDFVTKLNKKLKNDDKAKLTDYRRIASAYTRYDDGDVDAFEPILHRNLNALWYRSKDFVALGCDVSSKAVEKKYHTIIDPVSTILDDGINKGVRFLLISSCGIQTICKHRTPAVAYEFKENCICIVVEFNYTPQLEEK